MRIQIIFGFLWIFSQTTMGSLIQDPVICRFNENNQCYVALGQQLHLQLPLEETDWFQLMFTDKTSTTRIILRYRKTQSNPPTPNPPRWQFINDNNTMILTSAEQRDSGIYRLLIDDKTGTEKGRYSLQLNTEKLKPVESPVSLSVEEWTTTEPTVSPSAEVSCSTKSFHGFMVFASVWLCEIIILMSLLVGALYIYTRIYRKLRRT